MTKQKKTNKPIKLKESATELPSLLDITSTPALLAQLRSLAESSQPVVLGADKVERITTPAIQTLLSAARFIEKAGQTFRIQNPSASVQKAFAQLGLEPELLQRK